MTGDIRMGSTIQPRTYKFCFCLDEPHQFGNGGLTKTFKEPLWNQESCRCIENKSCDPFSDRYIHTYTNPYELIIHMQAYYEHAVDFPVKTWKNPVMNMWEPKRQDNMALETEICTQNTQKQKYVANLAHCTWWDGKCYSFQQSKPHCP